MQQALETLTFRTSGAGLHEITDEVGGWLRGTGIAAGVLTLFCQHTSAGLLITENASPAVPRDLSAGSRGRRPKATATNTRTRAPTTCRRTSAR